MLDEELYEALSRQAAAEGVSRAELLRRFAREGLAAAAKKFGEAD